MSYSLFYYQYTIYFNNYLLANLFILIFITITFYKYFMYFIYLNKLNILILMYTYSCTAPPNGYFQIYGAL